MLLMTLFLFSIVGVALAGSGAVIAMATSEDASPPILVAAAAGAFLALPIGWLLSNQLI